MSEETNIDPQEERGDALASPGVQTPDVDKKGKVRRSAFKDGKQAYQSYVQLKQDNQVRTSINAELVARHTGKPPHDSKELTAWGQDWRSNFPTLTLMGLEGRITARLVTTIDNLRVLTNSYLPDDIEGHDEKSKLFQQKLTAYIRRWKGWRPFVFSLCTEDVLIGYAVAGMTDDYNWRPYLYRSDQSFVPQGCGQFPEFAQMAALDRSYMIHEALEWIENGKEVADVAGFEFQNVIDSVNKSMPKNPLLDHQGAASQTRTYQDLMREGSVGTSFTTGAKGIDVAIILGIEPDTKGVSMYMVDRNNSNETLYFKKDRFESMSDALCFFTLEPGNSTFHGSKGVARKTVNICTAMDVSANDAVDAYRLSALGVLYATSKGGINTQIKVTNPFVVVTTDAKLEQQVFNFNAEAFVQLYGKLGDILEHAVGEYIPNLPNPQDPAKDKTATAERIDFQREQEQSIAFIGRFLGQFFELIAPMQKRLLDPETTDEDAMALQAELKSLEFTEEELQLLRDSPTAEVVQDLATQMNQQIDLVSQRYGPGTPGGQFVDQKKLASRDIAALSSPQVANELLLEDEIDPTVEAEQLRTQIFENTAIQASNPVNVSPRDNDKVHLDVLVGELKSAAPGLMKKRMDDPDLPKLMDNLNSAIVHADAHLNQWKQKGGDPKEIAQYEQFFQQADQQLVKMAQTLQKFRQMQPSQGDPSQQQGQQQVPPQQPQGPPQPTPHQVAQAKISESLNYKDAPEDIRRQMEAQAGFTPSKQGAHPTNAIDSVNTAAQRIPASQPAIQPPAAPTPQ